MSVQQAPTTVMQTLSALIPLPATTAPAIMDLLEMDKIAQVIIA